MQHLTVFFNKIWCLIFFPLSLIRVKREYRYKPSANDVVVYCSNHASYMDIPMLTYVLPGFIAFIGKSVIAKVPLFGFYFTRLHVSVDRQSKTDRYKAFQQSLEKIDQGRSLVYFPEGRINEKIQPGLASFKDGAFRAAIAKQIPVVPVTIPFNWLLLPDDGQFAPNFITSKVIIHEPIDTQGMTEADVESLRDRVHNIIDAEIKAQNKIHLQKQ